jgi:lipopolysaccharide transport system permease protein
MMLLVYTFVFGVIFKARWGGSGASKTEFALILFAGLIVFNLFSDCVNRAPSLIVANVNYVKKIIFPLEILPVVTLLAALYHALVSLAVWVVAYGLIYGMPHASLIYLPLIIAPFSLFVLGGCWILASLGVFLRDVAQVIGVFVTVLMFLSPIFYPATALPEGYRELIFFNPLTLAVEQVRDALFWGRSPDMVALGIYWVLSLVVAWLGYSWFQKTRKGFADVL